MTPEPSLPLRENRSIRTVLVLGLGLASALFSILVVAGYGFQVLAYSNAAYIGFSYATSLLILSVMCASPLAVMNIFAQIKPWGYSRVLTVITAIVVSIQGIFTCRFLAFSL